MNIDAPMTVHRETVHPDWIDYNGHMNVAYYLMAADHAMEGFAEKIGVDESYMKATNRSTFALDTRIIYVRELVVGAPLSVTAQLIGYDKKRIHVCLALTHGEEGWLSALSEWVLVHVDLGARRSEPMPEKTLAMLEQIMAAHANLPRPEALVRPFGLGK
ncbi:MAG: thioesterase-like protein [Rhodospirillaceae bacterium]|nr:thioesterase-like protein [Rhodospirillaceae bacterium]MBT3927975.1 thioesterase-like protein [Rhodospirillaceae bacterium]MBT6828743.1 thioesterase-like protein [Rhodospirillaceae bacterium]